MRRAGWLVVGILIVLAALPPLLILIGRFVPPIMTPLMLVRAAEGYGIDRKWVDAESLPLVLEQAAIASEDAHFCTHHGFDWGAIREAWDADEARHRRLGGSTITQQTAKNLFLWPGGGWVRKALEVYPTIWLELLWPKRRILQTYLNIIEWGPGIYGAEAASQHYFRRAAAKLTAQEAALLVAVLPNPRRFSPAAPSTYIRGRTAMIEARASSADTGCFR